MKPSPNKPKVTRPFTESEQQLAEKILALLPSPRQLVLCLIELWHQGYYEAAHAVTRQLEKETAKLEQELAQMKLNHNGGDL